MDVILASNNQGKIKEIKQILSDTDINIVSLKEIGFNEEIKEDGKTFLENALIKAKTIYDVYKRPVIADDSGLCVLSLDLFPGVNTARAFGDVSDEEKRKQLVLKLGDNVDRRAYFTATIVFYVSDSEYYHFEGRINGSIGLEDKGNNGFGYDPIFMLDNGLSLAEISDVEKNQISHRGLALKSFKEFIKNDFSNK